MNAAVLEDVKLSAKRLINKPTKIKKVPSLEETVNSILEAHNPALKAHATRNLRSYAIHHSKAIGSTPTRVIAGVCAAVTKRFGMSDNKKPVKSSIKQPARLICSVPPLSDEEVVALREIICLRRDADPAINF